MKLSTRYVKSNSSIILMDNFQN